MIIKYAKKFPYAPYLNEDIGFEMSISDKDNPLEALAKLKSIAEQFHKENNHQIYEEQEEGILIGGKFRNSTTIVQQHIAKLTQEEKIIMDIHTCTDIKTLRSYKLIAKNNPKIQEHYTAKLSELNK